jgi:hypothetical protein
MQKIRIELERLHYQRATKEFTVIKPKEGEQSMMIKSYRSLTASKMPFITFSLLG